MSCGMARSSTRPTISPIQSRKSQTAIDGKPLRGSVGGPIVNDKLFFFFDSEWVRIALPIVTGDNSSNAGISKLRFAATALGGTDSVNGSRYQPAPQLVPFYQRMFSLYGNTSGTPLTVLGCPFDAGGVMPAIADDGNGCANRQSVSHSSADHEQVQTVRIDHNIDEKNTTWFRFQTDNGLQAAYTDPINPLFNSLSLQPCTLLQRDILTSFRKIL